MLCGLFGKLPQKRDFIAVNMPREFLHVWEAWLQGGMAASKIALGPQWLQSYLTTPLWRFWMGAGICGLPTAGVFMPSMDGVGRHFPLSVFFCAEPADRLKLPGDPDNAAWYEALEEFLLYAIDEGVAYEEVLERLNLLPLSGREPAPAPATGLTTWHGVAIATGAAPEDLGASFHMLEEEERRLRLLSTSYWWSVGGVDHAASAMVAKGMPDPHILSAMISGTMPTPSEPASI